MPQIYEGMFVLDNNVVREGWNDAKALVTGALEKHGGTVHSARRWDERRLAYPIAGKNRGTFLLAYYEMPTDAIPAMRREFDLSEKVLRYLEIAVDAIPEGEADLAGAENSSDFSVPEPPADDAPDEPEESEEESTEAKAEGEGDGEAKAEGDGEAKAEGAEEAKAEETPAAEEKPAEAATESAPEGEEKKEEA